MIISRHGRRAFRAAHRSLPLSLVLAFGYVAVPTAVSAHEGHGDSSEPWLSRITSDPTALAFISAGVALALIGFRLASKHPKTRGRRWPLLILTALAALPALTVAAITLSDSLAADTSPASAVDYSGLALDGEAPQFSLTDQRGTSVALEELRGRVVLLAFLDPKCTDICPLTALHLREVHDVLGTSGPEVALLAVNVNPDQTSVAAVAEASERWGVGDLTSWHFLTGEARELEAVRAAYGALGGVPKDGKTGEVVHTPGVWVIDQIGVQRWYVSIPDGAGAEEIWDGPSLTEVLRVHVHELLEP